MARTAITRGVTAGAVGGLGYGLFVALVANPFVAAIETHEHAGTHAAAVGEPTTALVSIGAGVLWGTLLGGLFGVGYYLFEPALPGRARVRPYVLAGAGFLTVSVTPWLVLPPAVPGTEYALSAAVRLALYGALVCFGGILAAGTVLVYRRLAGQIDTPRAAVASLGLLVATAVTVGVATPQLSTGATAGPALTAAFRGTVVLSQATLWVLIAGVFEQLHTGATSSTSPDSMQLLT